MSSKLSLKLLIDSRAQKVLFAEVGKEVVDFLFSLLTVPVGSVIKLLSKKDMAGCVASVYESVKSLDDAYYQTKYDRNLLLSPKTMSPTPAQSPLQLPPPSPAPVKRYYSCKGSNCYNNNYVTDCCGVGCPSCGRSMAQEMEYVPPSVSVEVGGNSGGGGYVKGVVTYMVMDDLTVSPMSTISSITLLNKFNVKEVGVLREKTVELGMEEGLKLLKTSLQSTTVLTDVFLGSK